MLKTGNLIIFAAILLFSVTFTHSIAWCGPTLPLPFPREVDIEYLETMQRDLPENYIEVVQYILENNRDPYIRERCVYTLTDIAINKNEADNIIGYLKDLAMNEDDDAIRTSAYANIDLIRDFYPRDKKGSLDVYISGIVKKGSTISLVAKISSTIDTEEEAIVGITSLHNNIELLSNSAVQRVYLQSNRPQEIKFELRLNETGNYFIPVTFLLSLDRIEYEEYHKKIYVEVNDESDTCLDNQNPNEADYEPDGDIDGSDLINFIAEYGGPDQACYDIQWFAQLFGMNNPYDDQEPGSVYELKPDRFVTVKPTLKSLVCPSGCECLTGPDAETKFGYGSFDACSDNVCGHGWVGDLYMEKYCYSEISIDECIDTDGGKNYEVKGSAPGCVDRCSEFSHPPTVLNECYAQVVDGKCQVNVAYYYCDSICEDGKCLPATCDDWIQNQGEEGVDCGGPCYDRCICPSGCKCVTGIEAANKFGEGSYMTCTDVACGE